MSILGVALAIAGLHHGYFEFLQGNTTTNGVIIHSIGPGQQKWIYGTDDAVTIIANFMASGILSMLTSVVIIIWSVFFLNRKNGSTVFFVLFILLTLFGGGIGHVVFYILVWIFSRKIRRDLVWWEKKLPGKTRKNVQNFWPVTGILSALLFLIGLEISVFGYVPGTSNPDTIFTICWIFLGLSLLLIVFTYISGFAFDIEQNKTRGYKIYLFSSTIICFVLVLFPTNLCNEAKRIKQEYTVRRVLGLFNCLSKFDRICV